MNRRTFMQIGAGTAVMLTAPRWSWAFSHTPGTIPLFATALRGVGPGGIPVAAPDPFPAPVTRAIHYTMDIGQFQDDGVCPTLGSTTLWGYNPVRPLGGGVQPQKHLGGILVGMKGVPIQLTFRNKLNVSKHILPNDVTLPGASLACNRVTVHLHGGFTPWISDGGPFSWFDPKGNIGPSFLNNAVLNPAAAPGEAEYYYPLNQSARMLWYHDHAMGITRLNAYAGLASAMLIRDAFEINLKNRGLPEFIENSVLGGRTVVELPLVIQDKIFVGPNLSGTDPTYEGVNTAGSLWYAHVYERSRYALRGNATGGNLIPPDPSVVPEFFGDTMLVNGTAFPTVRVEPRRYRLRLLNACNARFLNLQLYLADGSANAITLDRDGNPMNAPALCDPNRPGEAASVLQIGTEGGFLPKPVRIPTNIPFDDPASSSLIVAPAERPDLLIDFSAHAGNSIILYNDAPAPFPMGDARNDYFPGWNGGVNHSSNSVNAITPPGFGPNSRVLMRFEVGTTETGPVDAPLNIETTTDMSAGLDAPLIPFGVSTPPPGVPVRSLTLSETADAYGRLIQMLDTIDEVNSKRKEFGRPYDDPATETPMKGTTEVWEIYNTTGDVHPMHFHLVNVQVINRQPFQVKSLGSTSGGVNFSDEPTPAEPNETGWKETVKMYPGTVTRIIMRFDLPSVPFVVPTSPRTGGHEYVWHCHILEHEEHDMMRPLVVV